MPLAAPTATVPASAPTPAVSGVPALMRQIWLPLAASSRASVPSAAATNTLPPASAGLNNAVPALPILTVHALFTFIDGLKSTSAAGGLRGAGLLAKGLSDCKVEQPPRTASAMPMDAAFAAMCIGFPFVMGAMDGPDNLRQPGWPRLWR